MAKHALLNLLIVKKSEKVASSLQQLSAFNEPMSHLWKYGIEDVLLDAMARHTRNRLDRYFPSALRRPTVQVRNRPLLSRLRIVQVFDTKASAVTQNRPMMVT